MASYIYVKTPGMYKLSFNISSFLKDRHINIRLNNFTLIENFTVSQVRGILSLQLNLSKGTNLLILHSLEEPKKSPLSLEKRKLSIQISNIEFKKL